MKRIEVTPNGEVWFEQRAEWVLTTPWDTVPIFDLGDLPKVAEALHYALVRFEGERQVLGERPVIDVNLPDDAEG